jgi:adenylate cyclase
MDSTPSWNELPPVARLEFDDPTHGLRRVDLNADCRIGRHASNDLQLAHHRVSRDHAWLKRDRDGCFWISDLRSRNGTFVNQVRVQETVRLANGDEIRIGDFLLRFTCDGPATPSTTTEGSEMTSIPQVRWLLVADIAGFTELSQRLDTTALRAVVDQWCASCVHAVLRSGGHLNKQMGDGLLFFWTSDQAEPAALVRTLAELFALQREANPRFRICLHLPEPSGVSLERRGATEELLGGEVNFVFRMDDVAKGLGAAQLLSAPAAAALQDELTLVALGTSPVADFPGQYEFYLPEFANTLDGPG